MDTTPNLQLPFILAAQAQKHVTHNEGLLVLDHIVQLAAEDRDLASPPPTPAEGQRFIVAAGATGAWSGHAGQIAVWQDGGWTFYSPLDGWVCYVRDENRLLVWTGVDWVDPASLIAALQNLSLLGVGTTADATNPLSAKLNNALWTAKTEAEGGDGSLRYKMNKESAGKTLSLLMQTAYSGRAEIGLTGDDDLRLKVSPDGSAWHEALVADRATGAVRLPNGLVHAETGLRPAMLLPAPIADIWRSDVDTPASTPRTYTIAAVSGSSVTITTNDVEQFFNSNMRNAAMVRLWNVTKAPAQAAWVNWNNAANQFSVHNAADVASWLPGETLRLGDPNPTGSNVLQQFAVDISNYLYNHFGAVFPQRGLKLAVTSQGVGGQAAIGFSGTGAAGTALGVRSGGDGARLSVFTDVFTTALSPISNSNLLFMNESIYAPATALAATRRLTVIGIWI